MRFEEISEAPGGPKDLTHSRFKKDIKANSHLYVERTGLTSLNGCPEVVNGDFFIGMNQIPDLTGGPRVINGSFLVYEMMSFKSLQGNLQEVHGYVQIVKCDLRSLEGFPKVVTGPIEISEHAHLGSLGEGLLPDVCEGKMKLHRLAIASLKGCPSIVKGNFEASFLPLTTLVGGPREVDGQYMVSLSNYGDLGSLEGLPEKVNGDVMIVGSGATNVVSLSNMHKSLKEMKGQLTIQAMQVTNVLSVFFIKGITKVSFDHGPVTQIVNKNLAKGRAGVVACQADLMEAGFSEHAKL